MHLKQLLHFVQHTEMFQSIETVWGDKEIVVRLPLIAILLEPESIYLLKTKFLKLSVIRNTSQRDLYIYMVILNCCMIMLHIIPKIL